jgi:hypothetical protein
MRRAQRRGYLLAMSISVQSSPASSFVAGHAGSAPPALIARVQAVLAADEGAASLPAAESLLRAGETLLKAVLDDSEAGRAVALDLLAADTCVTWAFEAAADEPGTLPARAEDAMRRIAELSL